jgi:NTE family protein
MSAPLPFGPTMTPDIDLANVRREARIGIAYSGGGDRIAVHLGIVQAFIEAHITPQHIAGASAGAFASVFHALDPQALTYLPLATRMVQQALPLLRPSRAGLVVRLLPALLKGLLFGAAGIELQSLNSNQRVRKLLEHSLPVKTFGALGASVSIGATNLLTGAETWFERDDVALISALLASAAIPALFPPVNIGGNLYVDGTIADNLPLFHLAQQGCEVIYACNVGYAGETTKPPTNLLDTLLQSESIGQYVADIREQEILRLRYPQIKVIPVRPQVELTALPSEIGPDDVPGIVTAAAAETRRILAAVTAQGAN